MSWPRIFEAARHLGSPVIFTDQAGNSPMIVLPLEDYERLLTKSQDFGRSSPVSMERLVEPKSEMESVFELPFEEEAPVSIYKNLAQKRSKESVRPVEGESLEEVKTISNNQEISLDERFYFEPLDDESKK